MENEKAIIIVALLLINKGVPLNSSHRIIQILEWKFGVIETKYILDKIKQEIYAEFDLVKGIHYYRITADGIAFVQQEHNKALEVY